MHCIVVAASIVVTMAVVSFPVIAAGISWTQLGADIDGESAEDESGYSIALSGDGNRLAIGAEENDGGGDGAGHVRVYDWNGTAWTQTGADIDGENVDDESGWSVALSTDGSRVAIGAFRNSGSGSEAGHVRVYAWNGTAWVQLGADIDGESADDWSGQEVALDSDGSRVAIGARFNDGGGDAAGHVRVYDWNGTAWTQVGADIDGESAGDESGMNIALSSDGKRLAIGAKENDGNGSTAGHVRVFDWNETSWTQIGADIDGESAGDDSGASVALSSDGNRLAIGADENNGSATGAGHVRVFDWNGTAWVQVGADIDGENADDDSGNSVALSADGNRLAIGAEDNDGSGVDAGHVRVYDWNGFVWIQVGADIDGESAGDESGRSVALSSNGNRVAIGAPENDASGDGAGHVRVFDFVSAGIPTLPEWGLILLMLSLMAIATWQLAIVPATATGVSGTVMMSGGSWLTSMLLAQGTATVGLGFYAVLVGPLVAHDGIGAFLAGVLLAVIVEGYRRTRC